ncbi:hypothetical protein TNIN_325751 [Trichonephila inaurata madagascariensis]|uniref:Uncharacterized protein n=1 Tax=Trichonephila inaurata madagascariensis TaxID=2747483 RepID=A0A8X6YHP0_9ARAC|nr:hypothetical protein TNIN_325751 [Trichonephila inaurata madagascariensis]
MRLKKERWIVEEQMRHVQQEHKLRIKAEEQNCLQEVPTQDEMCEEKGEISVDVIQDKDDLNPPQSIVKSKMIMKLKKKRQNCLKENPKNLAE